jgi:hypothetical protein
MKLTAIEIGALALLVGILAFAQRLAAWENKPLGNLLAVAASGGLVAWCFVYLPTSVAWGVAALAWSVGLWFLFPLGRKLIDSQREPPAVTELPLVVTAPDPTVALNVSAMWLERSAPDSQWTFKSKLRVVLTSLVAEGMDILAPDWEAGKGDVRIQLPQGFCCLQLEGPLGWKAEDWLTEVGRLHVLPGQTFRLWIGLDYSFSDADLKRRHDELRIGMLVVPVKIGGKYLEFKQRF